LFFSIDPERMLRSAAWRPLRASGTNAVRYGTMREVVMALKVVTASGELVSVGKPRPEILYRL